MKYFKFIGKNKGNYPYQLGLNTLKHNNEEFNNSKKCESGGLYFSNIDHIFNFLGYGDTLCVITLPEDTIVIKLNNKYKSNKIYIKRMIKGRLEIIKYLVSLGADIRVRNDWAIQWASKYGHLETVKYLVSLGANIRA